MKRIRTVLDALLIGALLLGSTYAITHPASDPRPYWQCTVGQLAAGVCHHTHVSIRGVVEYYRREEDGDLHIRLRALAPDNAFIVAECIPELGCSIPHVGDTITVRGISRRDAEHGWWEVHPVEDWQ